jgi:hypothetical protein
LLLEETMPQKYTGSPERSLHIPIEIVLNQDLRLYFLSKVPTVEPLINLLDWPQTWQIGPALLGLNLLEPRLVESRATVVIPLDDRVLFISSLNCAEFSVRLSEVAQTLDAISRIQFLVGGRRLGEAWLLGAV